MVLLVITICYLLNIVNLFETQAIIHLFCFWIFLIIIERQISKLDFTTVLTPYYEWVLLMRYLTMLKVWHLLIIRSHDIKMIKFLSFFLKMLKTLKKWLQAFATVYKIKYSRQVRRCTEYIFDRLRSRIRILKTICRQSNKKAIVVHLNIFN